MNLPLTKTQSTLHRYIRHRIERATTDCVTIENFVEDFNIIDPLEITIDGSCSNGLYKYDVRLYKYGGVLFEEVFTAGLPWDFLDLTSTLSGREHKDTAAALSRSEHPFHIRLKNGEITFTDCRGSGGYRPSNDPEENYWMASGGVGSVEIEAAGALVEMRTMETRGAEEVQARVVSLLLNNLLMLEKYSLKLSKCKGRIEDEIQADDVEYLTLRLIEFKRLYELLVEPVIPDLEKQLGGDKGPQSKYTDIVEVRRDMFKFRLLYAAVCSLVDKKSPSTATFVRQFLQVKEISETTSLLPTVVTTLYSSQEIVQRIRQKNKDLIQRVAEHRELALEGRSEDLEKGLIWRHSTLFLSLLRDDLAWKIIEYAFGARSSVGTGNLSSQVGKDKISCLYKTQVKDNVLRVGERTLNWTHNGVEKSTKLGGTIATPFDISVSNTLFVAFVETVRGFDDLKKLVTANLSSISNPDIFETYVQEGMFSGLSAHSLSWHFLYTLDISEKGTPQIQKFNLSIARYASLVDTRGLELLFAWWNEKWAGLDGENSARIDKSSVERLQFEVIEDKIYFQFLYFSLDKKVEQLLAIYSAQNWVLEAHKIISHDPKRLRKLEEASLNTKIVSIEGEVGILLPGERGCCLRIWKQDATQCVLDWSHSESVLRTKFSSLGAVHYIIDNSTLKIYSLVSETSTISLKTIALKLN